MKSRLKKMLRWKKLLWFFVPAAVLVFIVQVYNKTEAWYEYECVLDITKEVDKTQAGPGDVLTYILNFSNSGSADCTGGGVYVKDVVGDKVTFIEETHSDNVDAGYGSTPLFDSSTGILSWNAHTLSPGQSGFVSWTASINTPETCGNYEIPNIGEITAKEYNNFQDIVYSNEVRTTVDNQCPEPKCVLDISKEVDKTQASIGDILTYTLNFSNIGAVDCTGTGVKVRDAVDDNLLFLDEIHSDNVSEGYDGAPLYDESGRMLRWNAHELTPGETGSISWRAKVVEPENCGDFNIINKAYLTSWEYSQFNDLVYSNEVSTAVENQCPSPDTLMHFKKASCSSWSVLAGNGEADLYDETNGHFTEFTNYSQEEPHFPAVYSTKPITFDEIPQSCEAKEGWNFQLSTNMEQTENVSTVGPTNTSGEAEIYFSELSDEQRAAVENGGSLWLSEIMQNSGEFGALRCYQDAQYGDNIEQIEFVQGETRPNDVYCIAYNVMQLPVTADIALTKIANPIQLPSNGGQVAYSYSVTNPGNVTLSSITLTDDKCSEVAFNSGDTNGDQKLDTSETWTYSCSMNIASTTTNIATVTGKYGDNTVTKTATATVTVANVEPAPAIHVSKSADKTSLPCGGGDVKYSYVITNPGNVALSDITLTDDKCSSVSYISGDANSNSKLDQGESWNYSCQKNITSNTTNKATATGKYGDQAVTAEAQLTVSVQQSCGGGGGGGGGGGVIVSQGIKVVKTPVPAALPVSGGDVTYKYAVSNIGSSQLHDVTLVDDKCSDVKYLSGDINSDKWLQLTETWNYECKMNLTATTTNTATATGYAGSEKVTGKATATVTLGLSGPRIKLTKTANPAALPAKGGKVVYEYFISNPGADPLSNVTLIDDKCSPVQLKDGDANSDGKLDASEKWRYQCDVVLHESTVNFATARGSVGGVYATDTASANVTVGEVIVPVIMPKTGGGAAYQEEQGKKGMLLSITSTMMILAYAFKPKKARL